MTVVEYEFGACPHCGAAPEMCGMTDVAQVALGFVDLCCQDCDGHPEKRTVVG